MARPTRWAEDFGFWGPRMYYVSKTMLNKHNFQRMCFSSFPVLFASVDINHGKKNLVYFKKRKEEGVAHALTKTHHCSKATSYVAIENTLV
jgi:hypothetical protein